MKWRFWGQDIGPLEGQKAREQAEKDLARTRAETPKYAALGGALRDIREANHLTELLWAIHTRRRR